MSIGSSCGNLHVSERRIEPVPDWLIYRKGAKARARIVVYTRSERCSVQRLSVTLNVNTNHRGVMKDAVIFRSLWKDQKGYRGRPRIQCRGGQYFRGFAQTTTAGMFLPLGSSVVPCLTFLFWNSRETTLTYAPPFICTSGVPSVTLLQPGHSPMGVFETMLKVALPSVGVSTC